MDNRIPGPPDYGPALVQYTHNHIHATDIKMDKAGEYTLTYAKDDLKYQLFILLEQLPKALQTTQSLRQIVEALLVDIVYFAAEGTPSAQQLLYDSLTQVEQRFNKLSTISVDNPVY